MAKKKSDYEKPAATLEQYEVRNLKESTFPVQFYNDNGQVEYMDLLIQGRMGAKPPVIASTAITDQMRALEKKGFIRLVKVVQAAN